MEFVGDRYYNLNRMLLRSIGLWPYQNPKMMKFQRVISTVILVSSIIVQLLKFVTTEYSLDLLLKVLSFTTPCMVFVLKYISFCLGAESVRNLMENVVNEWNILRTEVELEIIKKQSDLGRFYTVFFTLN
ncbi:PREDICTED: uncharacterized protein LOC106748294 [Dinoponera quadriceps]|uniref:Uncharacterized protein LOC106748294 n=1 Tax=Dinoponera quadriceps TaxID=609295 RepID=A0A6P3XUH7_DINQU|nr:PREDICTED: uncharacterized protein LOC106748294 [Dinoponera quadriceps]